jgi:hypothetical protein
MLFQMAGIMSGDAAACLSRESRTEASQTSQSRFAVVRFRTSFDRQFSGQADALDALSIHRPQVSRPSPLIAEPGTRRYIGSAFVSVNREIRERLWKRVQEHAGPPR